MSWTEPEANGSLITGYTVTSSPGGKTCTTGSTSCTVTGLTNGTAYTFTVTATNDVGTSQPSRPSNSVKPVGSPELEPEPTKPEPELGTPAGPTARSVDGSCPNDRGAQQPVHRCADRQHA